MNKLIAATAAAVLLCGSAAHAATAAQVTQALKPANWDKFLAACKKTHTDENCLFLKSVGDYKAQADNAKRGVLAEQMMNFYIGTHATREVNISAANLTATQTGYAKAKKTKAFPNSLFNAAEADITKLTLNNINVDQKVTFAPVMSALK